MKPALRICSLVASAALAVTFVASGFAVCQLPVVTHALASHFACDALSPFDRTQLVRVADATRDFAFGTHDRASLLRTIYEVNREHRALLEQAGLPLPAGLPNVGAVGNPSDLEQLGLACADASEAYCLSDDALAHLDDCHALAQMAWPALATALALVVAALALLGGLGGGRGVGATLRRAGLLVIVAFTLLAAWAAIDFNGLFTVFHQLLFSQGNWQFPYDSLLICSLPTELWVGMAVIWLVTTIAMSALALVLGHMLIHAEKTDDAQGQATDDER